jgi:hypothetical protein
MCGSLPKVKLRGTKNREGQDKVGSTVVLTVLFVATIQRRINNLQPWCIAAKDSARLLVCKLLDAL